MEPWMKRLEEIRVNYKPSKPIPKFEGRIEAMKRKIEELLEIHMQKLREEIAGLKREVHEEEKRKEQELKTKMHNNEGGTENVDSELEDQEVGNRSIEEATKGEKSDPGVQTEPDREGKQEQVALELCEQKPDEAMMKNHDERKGTDEIEETKLVEGVIERQGGRAISAATQVWVSRKSFDTEGMSSKTEPASTIAWVSSKPYGPPPPSLKYKPEPPKGREEVWRRRPPKAVEIVNRGSESSDKAPRRSGYSFAIWFRCLAVEGERLMRRSVADVPHEGLTRPRSSLDLWAASHGRFAHVFAKNEIRDETIKKKEGGAMMELYKLGHLLDLMGQAQIIEQKERAFESENKYSSLMEGLQFKERRAWAYAKDALQKSEETLSKSVVLIGEGYSADEFTWTRLTVAGIRLCFLAKSINQNRSFDPRGSSSNSGITWSLYFKLWDPSGIYFLQSISFTLRTR